MDIKFKDKEWAALKQEAYASCEVEGGMDPFVESDLNDYDVDDELVITVHVEAKFYVDMNRIMDAIPARILRGLNVHDWIKTAGEGLVVNNTMEDIVRDENLLVKELLRYLEKYR